MRLGLAPLLLAALAVASSAIPSPAATSSAGPSAPETVSFSAVALAPNGHALAWAAASHGESELHVASLPGGTSSDASALPEHTISPSGSGSCSNSNPVWSPDSSTLALTSTCGAPQNTAAQQQIFLYSPATGTTRQLTHLAGKIEDLTFSPDGRTLAFLYVENATRSAGALDAMKPWSGVIGEDGVEIQRVAAVSLASGQLSQVTPATLHVYEFSWSPDSHSLSYIAANPPGENNWWVARLYTQSAQADAAPVILLDPTKVAGPLHNLQIAVPRWSPDGHSIALIGGLMSDQGSTGGDIYLIPATGGTPHNLTPDRPSSPSWFTWLPSATAPHTLLVSEDAQASTHLFRLNAETGVEATEDQLRYTGSLHSGGIKDALSVATNGEIATIRSSFSDPPEVVVGQPSRLRAITHANDALRGTEPRTESVEWTNEGFHVQGWLTFPAHFDVTRHYPLIVSVHGGPSASIRSTWGQQSVYSDAGYFVLQPNPRGSFGQGARFTQANVKDFGYGDLRDILAGLDAVEHKFPVDPHREGLGGWSYGGFMTMFAVTQTHRFRAAVAGAGIADWQSYYGENSIDQWMTPFFGDSVYNDPAIYAKSSAINFIKQVTTPTLVIVGDRDGECPAPQSFEFWHALRAEGVQTQLVIYPAEGHRFRDPAHIEDRTRRELAWFARYMPAPDANTASSHQ